MNSEKMKAISLLLLRLSTGIYLVLWGIRKFDAEGAARMSDNYYGGLVSDATLNIGIGSAQVLLGLIVVLGLFRAYAYLGQLAWYAIGVLPIIAFLLDPLALYLVEQGRLTWFPSWTLLFASLVLVVFKESDTITLDSKLAK